MKQSVFLSPGVYQIGCSVYLPRNGQDNAGDPVFSSAAAGDLLARFDTSNMSVKHRYNYKGSTKIDTAGNPPMPVPAPGAFMVFGAGVMGLAWARRRRG